MWPKMALLVDLYASKPILAIVFMAFLPNGDPELSPKQKALLRLCRERTGMMKLIGLFGTRISGKTTGAEHCIADHLWNTKSGSCLMLCYTAGTAATSGVWNEVTEKVLPEWIAQGFGMDWYVRPKTDGATKKMVCSVINKYGAEALANGEEIPAYGISKLELDGLDDEREVEKKYKSRYYSMIYWSEAGEFRQELTMMTLVMALRIAGLPDDQHILLIDANPPDNGTDHFLYKFFYELRIAREEDCDVSEQMIRRCLHITEWTMDDNPFVSDERKAVTRKMYEKNPDLYDRYVLGKWTKAVKDALFADVFSPRVHVVGNPKDADPELLLPSEDCSELIVGLDAGGVNPCAHIIEKTYFTQDDQKEASGFSFLDELAFIGEDIQVSEYTLLLLKKMEFWEQQVGKPVNWSFWADSSALNFKESIANRTVADEMFAVSEGRIRLVGVDKGKGSVGNRIRLWRKLLIQNRILISVRCPKLIEMCQCINRGRVPGTVAAHTVHKHPFDSATYAVSRECWDELMEKVREVRTISQSAASKLITVKM